MNTARQIAHYMCHHTGWKLSNMKLQRLLYICFVMHYKETGKALFDDEFEAWIYGPVIPHLYSEFRRFGMLPVSYFAFDKQLPTIKPDSAIKTITEVADFGVTKAPSWLMRITHVDGGAWAHAYTPKQDTIITPTQAAKDYQVWERVATQ